METLIKKLVNAESGEVRALLWSFAYFFFLLSTYYMLLPLRDAMGLEGGTRACSELRRVQPRGRQPRGAAAEAPRPGRGRTGPDWDGAEADPAGRCHRSAQAQDQARGRGRLTKREFLSE